MHQQAEDKESASACREEASGAGMSHRRCPRQPPNPGPGLRAAVESKQLMRRCSYDNNIAMGRACKGALSPAGRRKWLVGPGVVGGYATVHPKHWALPVTTMQGKAPWGGGLHWFALFPATVSTPRFSKINERGKNLLPVQTSPWRRIAPGRDGNIWGE